MSNEGIKRRGFASMDAARQREIASMGGSAVPAEKRSFFTDPDLAAAAGRKGGANLAPDKRSFSTNRELAAAAGRKGGLNGHKTRRAAPGVQRDRVLAYHAEHPYTHPIEVAEALVLLPEYVRETFDRNGIGYEQRKRGPKVALIALRGSVA